MGNLNQSHFNYYDDLNNENFSEDKDNINYIGYYEPHPLDNKIVLRIGLKTEYEESIKSDDTIYTSHRTLSRLIKSTDTNEHYLKLNVSNLLNGLLLFLTNLLNFFSFLLPLYVNISSLFLSFL